VGNLLLVTGAFIAVATLILIGTKLGLSHPPHLASTEQAIAEAATLPGGFAGVDAALDRHGRGALVQDSAARVAVVLSHGAHFITRLITADWTVQPGKGGELHLSGEGAAVSLDLGDPAGLWIARIGTALGRSRQP
jgi:hypothetical protein